MEKLYRVVWEWKAGEEGIGGGQGTKCYPLALADRTAKWANKHEPRIRHWIRPCAEEATS